MLNSAQVVALTRRLDTESLILNHEGMSIERLDPGQRDPGELIWAEAATHVSMHAPAFVLGEPAIPSCLTGVVDSRLPVPEKAVRKFTDARVVGWRSVASCVGFFSSAQNYIGGDVGGFLSTPHEGFAPSGASLLCVSNSGERLLVGGRTLFLSGLEAGNYGSFLFRFLPKLLYFRELGLAVDQVVVPDKLSFVSQAMAMVGWPDVKLISVRESVNLVFETLFMVDDFDAEGAQCGHSRRRLLKLLGPTVRTRRLYVSRYLSSGYRPSYRPLDNELAIQKELVALGFELVFPELLTLGQQMEIFSQAQMVAGPSGSGMLNAMFARPDCKVVDMESFTTTVRQHAKIYSSSGHEYAFVFGSFLDDRDTVPFMKRWTVPVSLVRQGVERFLDD